ncbi:unnamed protein product [Prunus brigantina]
MVLRILGYKSSALIVHVYKKVFLTLSPPCPTLNELRTKPAPHCDSLRARRRSLPVVANRRLFGRLSAECV